MVEGGMNFYQVWDVAERQKDCIEPLGTKKKFWFSMGEEGHQHDWLFKFSRQNTGEHWSEKIAEQLCKQLQIPHARYELARCSGVDGVISSRVFTQADCRMVMGNEVLHGKSPGYPAPENQGGKPVRVREHTVNRVLKCLSQNEIRPPDSEFDLAGLDAAGVFTGYLMLDVLISNQDRHHENWALIWDGENTLRLCPSFDHAASLARELTDGERLERLNSRDRNRQVATFVGKAHSQLYLTKNANKPLSTYDAFIQAAEKCQKAKEHWLLRLSELNMNDICNVVERVPKEMMSEVAREFAIQMILENQKRLLNHE
jgi:hypothetical protein